METRTWAPWALQTQVQVQEQVRDQVQEQVQERAQPQEQVRVRLRLQVQVRHALLQGRMSPGRLQPLTVHKRTHNRHETMHSQNPTRN